MYPLHDTVAIAALSYSGLEPFSEGLSQSWAASYLRLCCSVFDLLYHETVFTILFTLLSFNAVPFSSFLIAVYKKKPSSYWVRYWSHIATLIIVVVIIFFLLLLLLGTWGNLFKKPKAPSFQIGSGDDVILLKWRHCRVT